MTVGAPRRADGRGSPSAARWCHDPADPLRRWRPIGLAQGFLRSGAAQGRWLFSLLAACLGWLIAPGRAQSEGCRRRVAGCGLRAAGRWWRRCICAALGIEALRLANGMVRASWAALGELGSPAHHQPRIRARLTLVPHGPRDRPLQRPPTPWRTIRRRRRRPAQRHQACRPGAGGATRWHGAGGGPTGGAVAAAADLAPGAGPTGGVERRPAARSGGLAADGAAAGGKRGASWWWGWCWRSCRRAGRCPGRSSSPRPRPSGHGPSPVVAHQQRAAGAVGAALPGAGLVAGSAAAAAVSV